MTADERLALIRLKVERAKRHIVSLNVELKSFFDSQPYKVATHRDPKTLQLIYYLADVRAVPPGISLIAGDVIQNLRSALDHLAYQLYLIGPGGQAGGVGPRIYFPIADDAAKYKAEAPRKIKGLRPDAIKAINAIEPYKGGQTDKSETLWRLHKLNNADKHRLLITVGSAFRSVNLGTLLYPPLQRAVAGDPGFAEFAKGQPPQVFFRPADRMFPLKAGDVLLIDSPDADVNEKVEFRFEVAFGERQIMEDEPVIETLQHMADLVDNLIVSFRPLLI